MAQVSDLVRGFFRYYGDEFDVARCVVSIKRGDALRRDEAWAACAEIAPGRRTCSACPRRGKQRDGLAWRLALIDPFGFNTFSEVTRYWTVFDQNSRVVPLEGVFLQIGIVGPHPELARWVPVSAVGRGACAREEGIEGGSGVCWSARVPQLHGVGRVCGFGRHEVLGRSQRRRARSRHALGEGEAGGLAGQHQAHRATFGEAVYRARREVTSQHDGAGQTELVQGVEEHAAGSHEGDAGNQTRRSARLLARGTGRVGVVAHQPSGTSLEGSERGP